MRTELTELKNVRACVRLTLSGAFSIVWSMKVYSLEQRCSCGRFPGDYHFWQFAWTNGNVARESQHNTVNISVNTSRVESCTTTNFSEVVHPLNFSKNNFPLLKARPNTYLFTDDFVFSLKAKVVFFSPNIPNHVRNHWNESELVPTFDAAGQLRTIWVIVTQLMLRVAVLSWRGICVMHDICIGVYSPV